MLDTFGLPPAVLGASPAALAQVIAPSLAQRLAAPPDAAILAAIDATERWLARDSRHSLMTLADQDYPPLLLACGDPPPLLFCAGRRELLGSPALAIVGSRSASRQGQDNAAEFAAHLAAAGVTIASGLARGIDAAAHRGALDSGAPSATIAVVGTGVDIVYPAAHRALAQRIRDHGLIVSELPLGAGPLAWHFPRRNRIIAGLARGVLVVEAALQSGSLITARLAADYGREVYAIPGSIHAPLARGCHRLIRDGARLVESALEIVDELGLAHDGSAPAAAGAATRSAAAAAPLPPSQAALLAALGRDPADIDTLCARTGMATGSITADLLELELARHVERLPGNTYQRLG